MSASDLPQPDWRTIDAYLLGQASVEEQTNVRQWMAKSPRNAELVEEMRAALSPDAVAGVDVDVAWKSVANRVGIGAVRSADHDAKRATPVLSLRRPASRWTWMSAAAAVVLAAALGVRTLGHRAASPVVEIATTAGQRITRTLDDGSTVTLNAESRLRYTGDASGRRVDLEGEAIFHVRHDARRPFHVHVSGIVATDLGTQFNVRGYPELGRVDVAVIDGSVSLRRDAAPSDSVVLRAGMVGRATMGGALSVDSVVPARQMTAWLDGTLVFDATPLGQVIAALHRKYNVSVRVTDTTLQTRRVTATVRDETIEQALDAISLALGIQYRRQGDTIFVVPRK